MGMCIGSIVIDMNGALVLLTYWYVCWLALMSCQGSLCGLLCNGTVTVTSQMLYCRGTVRTYYDTWCVGVGFSYIPGFVFVTAVYSSLITTTLSVIKQVYYVYS
jgi:hypothetical protein